MTQTYNFGPQLTGIVAREGATGCQLISCGPVTSEVPDENGLRASFQIVQSGTYTPGNIFITITDENGIIEFYSGPVPVEVSTGFSPTIACAGANGSFTFRVSYCWGGGRGNPGHCQVVGVGDPCGSLTVTW